MSEVTLKLIKPIYNGTVTEVRLREPTAAEYAEIGDVIQLARSEGGILYHVETEGALKLYFERLVTYPSLPQARQIGLADAMAIKDTIIGFFSAAHRERQKPDDAATPQVNSEESATH